MADGDERVEGMRRLRIYEIADPDGDAFIESLSENPNVARLASDGSIGDILKGVKELNEPGVYQSKSDSVPGGSSAADGDGGASEGNCCGAYPAAALTAALGSSVDPRTLWAVLGKDERHELAGVVLKGAAEDRRTLLSRSAWATAPEMVLLDEISENREAFARKMLETRSVIDPSSVARRKAEADEAAARARVTANSAEVIAQAVAHMRKWQDLADSGLAFLKWSTVFSMLGIAYVLIFLVHGGRVDAGEGPVLIFLLVLFAVSPAVLLLRERPLKGIDEWSPGGSGDDGGDEGEGSEGADKRELDGAVRASAPARK